MAYIRLAAAMAWNGPDSSFSVKQAWACTVYGSLRDCAGLQDCRVTLEWALPWCCFYDLWYVLFLEPVIKWMARSTYCRWCGCIPNHSETTCFSSSLLMEYFSRLLYMEQSAPSMESERNIPDGKKVVQSKRWIISRTSMGSSIDE